MTDIAVYHRWFPARPARPAFHPLRVLGQVASSLRTPPAPEFDAPRPPRATSIDRWLQLYLRAHL